MAGFAVALARAVAKSFPNHQGRPGQVGGSLPREAAPDGQPSVKEWQASARVLAKVLGTEEVGVARTAVAIRAVPIVAQQLARMRDQGYAMPAAVQIMVGPEPAGLTSQGKSITVFVPPGLPADVSFDDATRAAMANITTVRSLAEIVVHEMGHVSHGLRTGKDVDWWSVTHDDSARAIEGVKQIAGKVSEYARINPNEFLAETFTRLYRGDQLPDDVHALYKRLNGKYPIGWKAAA